MGFISLIQIIHCSLSNTKIFYSMY